jgi:short-subunit dehydrogenase
MGPYAAAMTTPHQRVVAITGAGGGVGAALARRFAADGWRLALSDVDEASMAELAAELRAGGAEIRARPLDVRDAAAFEAWAAEVHGAFGGVDLLINNAGVTTWGRFGDQAQADIDWVMDVNVRGVMHGCRAFLPLLRQAERGHVVNVASMIGLFAAPLQTTYTASKWAIRGFSRALRLELRPEGIGVTVVLPGTLATPFMSRSRTYDDRASAKMTKLMRRYGTSPERVAARIAGAVRRDKGEVRVGWDSHLVAFVQRFLPGALPWFLGRLYPRMVADGKVHLADKS